MAGPSPDVGTAPEDGFGPEAGIAPDGISEREVTPARGLPRGAVALGLLGSLLVVALAGAFGGQSSPPLVAKTELADLSVSTPAILRSGMFFETTVDVTAHADLADATIALSPSLWRSITINTSMPQAGEEEFSDKLFKLHYGPLARGEAIHLKLDGQVNPDLFLGNRGDVALFDGEREIGRIAVRVKVLP
ncbi:hypothetical protein [Tsuneonella sp. HG222]